MPTHRDAIRFLRRNWFPTAYDILTHDSYVLEFFFYKLFLCIIFSTFLFIPISPYLPTEDGCGVASGFNSPWIRRGIVKGGAP